MRKNKLSKKCWACGVELPHFKIVPACNEAHYKLFIRSKTGDSLSDLLKRKPQLAEFV